MDQVLPLALSLPDADKLFSMDSIEAPDWFNLHTEEINEIPAAAH